MSNIKELQQKVAAANTEIQRLHGEMLADEGKRTPENREKFEKIFAEGKSLREQLDTAKEVAEFNDFVNKPDGKGTDGLDMQPFTGNDRKSFGRQIIESQQYKNADRSLHRMNPVQTPNLVKALINSTDTQGGYLVRADRETEVIDLARQRPPSILDLISTGETSVDGVEYVVFTGRTNNSAVVPEVATGRTHVSAGAGISADMIAADNGNYQENFAMKPKGDLAIDIRTATVKTIAQWIPASRQILADAPNLRSMIDDELLYMLRIFFENQVINGDGSGQNFTGMMNWAGIQERTHKNTNDRGGKADDNLADTLRRALTDIRLEFYEPDGILLNPNQGETLELEKDANNNYLKVYDPVTMRIWRVKVIETQAQPAGFAMVGNFKLGAKMWDREQSNIRVGEPGNFFLQNAVAILAEMRAAFAVRRPKALEKVDLIP